MTVAVTYYTQCPSCLTVFRVDPRHLRAAGGRVSCGLCGERFDSRQRLADHLPPDLPVIPEQDRRPGRPDAGVEAAPPAPEAYAAPVVSEPEPEPKSELEPEADVTPVRDEEPDWRDAIARDMEVAGSAPRPRRWPWLVGCLLALLVLGGQWLWFQREMLAQDPSWRPWVERLCIVAGCIPPPVHRPSAVAVVARTMRTHPTVNEALLFTAILVNRAGAPQVWPQLGLTLRDVHGRVLGRRWFSAREYLANAGWLGEPMPPGQTVRVRLEIRDPGRKAVGFEIAFR